MTHLDRESEVTVISIALGMVSSIGKQKREPIVKIPIRTLDALADAFRAGGLDPDAPNLGANRSPDTHRTTTRKDHRS